jgi:hypothetical protein
MMTVFSTAVDPDASRKFERWRQSNQLLDHYLNESDVCQPRRSPIG